MELEALLQVFLDKKNNRDLIKYALTFTGSLDDATDLVSDLLIKIYTDERMKNVEEPMAYFRACIRNSAYNKIKRDKRLVLLPYEDFQALKDCIPAPQENSYEDHQTRQEIREMLAQYKVPLKEAFILFHLDGYSIYYNGISRFESRRQAGMQKILARYASKTWHCCSSYGEPRSRSFG